MKQLILISVSSFLFDFVFPLLMLQVVYKSVFIVVVCL